MYRTPAAIHIWTRQRIFLECYFVPFSLIFFLVVVSINGVGIMCQMFLCVVPLSRLSTWKNNARERKYRVDAGCQNWKILIFPFNYYIFPDSKAEINIFPDVNKERLKYLDVDLSRKQSSARQSLVGHLLHNGAKYLLLVFMSGWIDEISRGGGGGGQGSYYFSPTNSRIFPWKHTIFPEFLFENPIIFQDFL